MAEPNRTNKHKQEETKASLRPGVKLRFDKYPEFREAQKSKSSYFSHIYKSCLAKVVVR